MLLILAVPIILARWTIDSIIWLAEGVRGTVQR